MNATVEASADEEYLPQTSFFVGARGVFQGGGCRGAAHVGAYQAALDCGVRLSEVAGTSAGSIIAALIGAGASPEYLKANLLELDFRTFLVPPEGSTIEHRWLSKPLRMIPIRWLVQQFHWGRAFLFGGAHSSIAIQVWMDARLAELLPNARSPIKFRDLVVPTSIVTTDLGEASVKVWSAEDTPGESVALAVRSSCSIPGFFQPVRMGLTMHVDGGILSNLPAFIFAQRPTSRSLGGRVLAFSLQEESAPPAKWTLGAVAEQLANTIVGGATELQTRVQPGVHVVPIPTLGVKATDFDLMSKDLAAALADSGRRSVIDFIRNEGVNLQAEFQRETIAADEDELYTDFVREAASPGKLLIVSGRDTLWFWKLFPTILAWRCAGATVKVFLSSCKTDEGRDWRERQRRAMLEGMGVQVSQAEVLPWRGFLIKRVDEHRDAAFILSSSQSNHSSFASMYVGKSHREVIRALELQFAEHGAGVTFPQSSIRVRASDGSDFIQKLKRGVWQYLPDEVTISMETISVPRVVLLNRRVRAYKLQQIGSLARVFRQFNVPIFGPAYVMSSEGKDVSPITPPIVECWGDKMVAVEGNTRILYAFLNGLEEIQALVVREVKQPLPGKPVELRRVLLSQRSISSEERIDGFNYELFRNIERAIRPEA